MNYSLGCGGGFFEGVNVGHHIVTEACLPVCGGGEIDLLHRRRHLLYCFGADAGDSQIALGFGEFEPEVAPEGEFSLGGEEGEHFLGSVAAYQGGFIAIVCHLSIW